MVKLSAKCSELEEGQAKLHTLLADMDTSIKSVAGAA